jgi:hypothetical protein
MDEWLSTAGDKACEELWIGVENVGTKRFRRDVDKSRSWWVGIIGRFGLVGAGAVGRPVQKLWIAGGQRDESAGQGCVGMCLAGVRGLEPRRLSGEGG